MNPLHEGDASAIRESRPSQDVRLGLRRDLGGMSGQSKGVRPSSAALIVAALLVSASVLVAASPYGLGGERTTTKTETTASTVTASSIQLHKVTFNETGLYCGGSGAYANEWAVTMDKITLVQPSNATLPFHDERPDGPAYKAISTITFTVPDGVYYFNDSFGGQGGPVNVNGSNVVVPLLFTGGPACP